jgi:hypothetical protein
MRLPELLCSVPASSAPACSSLHLPALLSQQAITQRSKRASIPAWPTVRHPKARLSKTRQLDRDLPQPMTTPLTAEADLDRRRRGTTRDLATTTTTTNKTPTSAPTPAAMTTTRTTATTATLNLLTPATTKTVQRSASVTTRALSLPVTPLTTMRLPLPLRLSSPTCPSSLQSMRPS